MTPRLVFDMDGVIARGDLLEYPKTPTLIDLRKSHTDLAPYDKHTSLVWNRLCGQCDVHILTWRSFDHAASDIHDWLIAHHMVIPKGIITCIPRREGYDFVQWKADIIKLLEPLVYFDDRPTIVTRVNACTATQAYLVNNPYDPENQGAYFAQRISDWREIGEIVGRKISTAVY